MPDSTSRCDKIPPEPTGTTFCTSLMNKKIILTDKNLHALIIIVVVNLFNILLVAVKGFCAYATGSFSIANSTIESFGDVFVGALIFVTRIQAKYCIDGGKFPRGRTTESLSNVIASVVMIVLACINGVISIDNFFADLFDPILKNEHLYVIGFNIALKLILFLICKLRRDVDQISVLARDQRTDILTNSVTFILALATRYWSKYFDLIGAFIIFVTICMNWSPILCSNCNKISGIQAQTWRRKIIEEIIETSNCAYDLNDLIIYHNGEQCIVEVYAETESHKIIENRRALCEKLLEIEWVRAAYVFLNSKQGSDCPHSEDEIFIDKRETFEIGNSIKDEERQLLPIKIV